MPDPVSFPVFLVMWNRRQNTTTPALHLRIARWLEDTGREPGARMLLMAFRGAGKSTLTGILCAWALYRDPNLRILVLAADDALAARMVRAVRRILERHPLTAHLRPPRAHQWAADRFTVERPAELRDPSMRAAGIGANVTGSRADLVVCDDVEVPNTCESAEKRQSLRARLSEIDYILVPGGRVLTIGTPHVDRTIYADETTDGFARLEIPLLDAQGQSAWPERFSVADIEALRARSGPRKFASQMMLRPLSISQSRLNPDLFSVYDGDLVWNREIGGLYVDGKRLVGAGAWWDPAFAAAGGDRSVLACVFTDEDGQYRVQRLAYLSADALGDEDEATAQCRAVARTAQELHLPCVTVETNGIGKFLPAILRREMARARTGCAIVEAVSRRPKDIRILEALDAPLAARRVHLHRSTLDTPFMEEIRGWRPGATGGHDDGLDALAGAISLQPVRVERPASARRPSWNAPGPLQAKTVL
ncbi:MAG TPA: phage terminase large subunit [Alphaproteobacteria bacterium]|nr:phage terminase large subunit [Alphaproteobacteria bacterium]